MNFGNVELPREVQKAIDADRLVVFAGAGVSCPPPSNLPLFNELAREICDDKVPEGQEDRMLGKKHRKKIDVHAACVKILHGEHTTHTELHKSILRLFKKGEKVRVVTTNFDNHFSTAAEKVYQKAPPKEYYAPALPYGDDFHGIVYVHGSVIEEKHKPEEEKHKLVLTDRDFGEAYLTRTWATNFLVELFYKYTVLFVGYSHNDVTMTYLARGLNPSTTQKRWALCPHNASNEELSNWQDLDINVMLYPLNDDNGNKHSRLSEFFSEWAEHRKSSSLSKAEQAKKLGSELPPESNDEKEFIEHCLQDKGLGGRLLSAIRHPAWFSWLENKQYFRVFFSESTDPLKDADRSIANWLVNYIRLEYPQLLFDIICHHQYRMHDDFADMLAHSVWVNCTEKNDQHFSQWILLLISSDKLKASKHFTTYLLNKCTLPKDRAVALQLFEIVTKPKLLLVEKFGNKSRCVSNLEGSSFAQKIDFKVGFSRDEYSIIKAWKKVFSPNLEHIWEPLLRLCEKQIHDIYSLQSQTHDSTQNDDFFNWYRSSIAAHEQDASPEDPCFSCLVDTLRDIIGFLMTSDDTRARMLRDSWWGSDILILQRLAVYSYSIDTSISPNEAIQWLISNNLLFQPRMKKEVFDVLAKFYGKASTKVKRQLLKRIDRGDTESRAKELSSEILNYEKYNVLVWLSRHANDCELLNNAVTQIKTKHPDFSEREHPEFNFLRGGMSFVDPSEEFDLDKILAHSPSEFIKSLKSSPKNSLRMDRGDHFNVLQTLFTKNRDWGCAFIKLLGQEAGIGRDIWNGILSALREVPKSSDDWQWLLALLEELPPKSAVYSGIAYLISHSIWNPESKPVNEELDRAASLMQTAWELCSRNAEVVTSVNLDCFTMATNHVGGWISEFWVHYCRHLYNQDQENWQGIPNEIKTMLTEAANGEMATQVNARIALTPWIGYWYIWDPGFSKTVFLPMLDWKKDRVTAQQTWSVLLKYHKGTSHDLEKILIPYYRELANEVSDLLKETADNAGKFDDRALQNFGRHIAAIATMDGTNPIESEFINYFFLRMPEPSRLGFAIWIKGFLKEAKVDKKKLWDLWLREYIDLRLIGMPIPISPQEGNSMLEWCLYLEPVFRDAVDRLSKVPHQKIFAYSFVKYLASSPVADREPAHACKLANVALEAEDYPYLHKELAALHKKWEPCISKTDAFERFEELLFNRGWQG